MTEIADQLKTEIDLALAKLRAYYISDPPKLESPVLELNNEDTWGLISISPDGAHAICEKVCEYYLRRDPHYHLLTFTENVKYGREGTHFYPDNPDRSQVKPGCIVWESNNVFFSFECEKSGDTISPTTMSMYRIVRGNNQASKPVLIVHQKLNSKTDKIEDFLSPESIRRLDTFKWWPHVYDRDSYDRLLFNHETRSIRVKYSHVEPYLIQLVSTDHLEDCPQVFRDLVSNITGDQSITKVLKRIEGPNLGHEFFVKHPALPLVACLENLGKKDSNGLLTILNPNGDIIYQASQIDTYWGCNLFYDSASWISPPNSDYDWIVLTTLEGEICSGPSPTPIHIHYIPKSALRG